MKKLLLIITLFLGFSGFGYSQEFSKCDSMFIGVTNFNDSLPQPFIDYPNVDTLFMDTNKNYYYIVLPKNEYTINIYNTTYTIIVSDNNIKINPEIMVDPMYFSWSCVNYCVYDLIIKY
jgi:hypothetical protein